MAAVAATAAGARLTAAVTTMTTTGADRRAQFCDQCQYPLPSYQLAHYHRRGTCRDQYQLPSRQLAFYPRRDTFGQAQCQTCVVCMCAAAATIAAVAAAAQATGQTVTTTTTKAAAATATTTTTATEAREQREGRGQQESELQAKRAGGARSSGEGQVL